MTLQYCHSGLDPESSLFDLDSRFRGNESSRLIVKKGDIGVNANYLPQASNSGIYSSLGIWFTDDLVIPRHHTTDASCIPTSVASPDIISSSPSPLAPTNYLSSLVTAFPPTYTFPHLVAVVISLCPNVPSHNLRKRMTPSNFKISPMITRSTGRTGKKEDCFFHQMFTLRQSRKLIITP